MPQKILVVGAGIIGASVAHYLSKAGAEVTIIDRGQPGMETTCKSFSWINANFPETPEYFSFRMASISEYHNLAQELKTDTGLSWGGSIWWESQGSDFDNYMEKWKKLDYEMEEISVSQFSNLERHIAAPPERAIRFNLEGSADPVMLTHRLISSALSQQAKLVPECEFQAFETRGNKIVGVITSLGQFNADTVVIAAGVQSQEILANLNIDLPMDNHEGILARTHPVDAMVQHVMLAPDIHFRQQTDGCILMGEDYGGHFSGQDSEETGKILLERLKRHLPGVSGLSVAEVSIGMRPMPADGFPIVGAPNGYEGLYVACMHSGITLAPIVGKLGASEIINHHNEPELHSYRLERFGNS